MTLWLGLEVDMTPTAERVRDYYDANTWKFLLTGGKRGIHRELWGPGVATRSQAVDYAHELVLGELPARSRRVLDLGSGVGSTALYLARRRPVEVVGVSLSPTQVQRADEFAAQSGPLRGGVRFLPGDFTALPDDLGEFDLALAIESFVHADPASGFLAEAARVLRPGGVLVVIDDVRVGAPEDPRYDDVRSGWHAATLVSEAEAAVLADAAGLDLVESLDLSSYQRLGRPRDRLTRAAQPVLRRLRRRSVWADSLVGGDALQRCHRAGLLEYRLLRFERRP